MAASEDFTILQGDTQPVFAQQITDAENPDGINLEGATVQLVLRSLTSPAPLVLTGAQTIADPASGIVQWQPSAADTAVAGTFMGKWRITWESGDVQSYPTDGYLSILIEDNLAANGEMQLISLPEVRDAINLPANVHVEDDKLLRWLKMATVLIESIVGPVVVRQFDEWHDGGNTFIKLRRRPSSAIGCDPVIRLIMCSEYNGPIEWPLAIVSSPDLGQTYSCMLDKRRGRVERRTAGGGVQTFPQMPESVHVIYEAGQAFVPENVQMAAIETVRSYVETTMDVGRGRRTNADQLDSGPQLTMVLPPAARRLLSPMRKAPSVA
jgi:hypothetical protein